MSLSFSFRKGLLDKGISACWSANMAAALGIAKTATEIFLGVGQVSIDNLTFKLFYKWSVTLFIVCSVLVCTSQFFGEPVQCETVSGLWNKLYKQDCIVRSKTINYKSSIAIKFLINQTGRRQRRWRCVKFVLLDVQ